MNILYKTHKGGNTKYATISATDRKMILSRLTSNFFRMLEEARDSQEIRDVLAFPEKTFRTNKNGSVNSIQSFLSGILAQHHVAERDFSIWHLDGITLASQVFDQYYNTGVITFTEATEEDLDDTPDVFRTLFEKNN